MTSVSASSADNRRRPATKTTHIFAVNCMSVVPPTDRHWRGAFFACCGKRLLQVVWPVCPTCQCARRKKDGIDKTLAAMQTRRARAAIATMLQLVRVVCCGGGGGGFWRAGNGIVGEEVMAACQLPSFAAVCRMRLCRLIKPYAAKTIARKEAGQD